jgi:L-arabinokinase
MVLVFYISGHGLGHAARDIEVINTLLRTRPDVRIDVRTSAPRWLFETFVRGHVELQTLAVDTGVTQIDSIRLDESDTAIRAREFYSTFAGRAESEAGVLASLGASAVVSDLPPLAMAAAKRAGIPSIALGNFTWDWIYQGYPEFEQRAPGVVAIIRDAYSHTTRSLRLPFHGGFEPMRSVNQDIPLIARHAGHRRETVRQMLGLPDDQVVVLASFGGYGLNLRYREIAGRSRFVLIATDLEAPDGGGGSGIDRPGDPFRRFRIADLARQGLYYPDLVAAADVVVGKPGYGIVSECIANGAALLYTDRGRFAEHDVFVAEMPSVLRCAFIPREDLLEGRWADAIDSLLGQPDPPRRLPTNGADIAARSVLELADGTSAP